VKSLRGDNHFSFYVRGLLCSSREGFILAVIGIGVEKAQRKFGSRARSGGGFRWGVEKSLILLQTEGCRR